MVFSTQGRPDPDALLRDMAQDAGRAARGRLRLYFGASAGVGKTCAMLQAAQTLHNEGVDVLAGVIETHGRAETAALLSGLPQQPLQAMAYRGLTLSEFDLDGVLTRKPALVLVDELAHSNAHGARHAKRWQDVEELLEAGIDVWTTLNVQHLDSLNDAVGTITGIRVTETVPDPVFDAAHEVILVDVPADVLLQRLQEGKVYLAEQARRAGRNFFRKGNLIALRELALRRTAERVDADVQAYRHDQSIQPVWRTREAILLCIAPDDDAGALVRAASRLARQLQCTWHVLTLDDAAVQSTPRQRQTLQTPRSALQDAACEHARHLGARVDKLGASDSPRGISTMLQAYVRRHNMTKVLYGRPATSGQAARWRARLLPAGWRRRTRWLESFSRACPDIDLVGLAPAPHAASAASSAMPASPGRPRTDADGSSSAPVTGWLFWRGYVWSAAACAAMTALASLLTPLLHETNIAMLYLLVVVCVALRLGRGPASLASVIGVALFDYFFVQPYHSFAVTDVQYVLTFGVLLSMGLLVGQLTAGLRQQAKTSMQRENEVRGLYEFAREMSSALQLEQIAEATRTFIDAAFASRCALFIPGADGQLQRVSSGATTRSDVNVPSPADADAEADVAVAQWVCDHGRPAGAGTATLAGSAALYLPLQTPMQVRGVLVLAGNAALPGAPAPGQLAQAGLRRRLDAYTSLIAIAVERVHYIDVAQQALLSVESEKLRHALLASVSHDLRTPLTSLLGMTELLLRGEPPLPPVRRDVVQQIRQQARRMHEQIVNLLDMARLQGRQVQLRREWQSVEELVGAAMAAVQEPLLLHHVHIAALSALPLVECDGVLIERVLCNLLENAAKYTPPGSNITIAAEVHAAQLLITVSDDGPGIEAGMEQRIFEKFMRGERESALPGVGLGLAVSAAIISAHHGRIFAGPASAGVGGKGRGARFTIELPLGIAPPLPPECTPRAI